MRRTGPTSALGPISAMSLAFAGALAGLGSVAAPSPAEAQSRASRDVTRWQAYADPGAVVAAEIGFNQLAQAQGQWTAFRETAAREAVMFVPQRIQAHDWLKGRANPAVSKRWQPHEVWMSCDGSYAVTRSAWQDAERAGFLITVWQRQRRQDQRRQAGYKWVLSLEQALDTPATPPEMIVGTVAECLEPAARIDRDARIVPLTDPTSAKANDESLRWVADIDENGAGTFTVELRKRRDYEQVLRAEIAPSD